MQLVGTVQNGSRVLCCTHTLLSTEDFFLKLKERQNSGKSRGSAQPSPPLTLNCGEVFGERRKEDESGEQNIQEYCNHTIRAAVIIGSAATVNFFRYHKVCRWCNFFVITRSAAAVGSCFFLL